jgi:antitoxin component of MazEF toxin-antitoxin module
MNTQRIFQAGNSKVVSIPSELLKDLKLDVGHKVSVEKLDDDSLIIKKSTKAASKKLSQKEFTKWLDNVLVEDADTLKDLANR